MSVERLKEILNSRKDYIKQYYNPEKRDVALFEINVLIKIVDKAYNTDEYLELIGKKRKRTKPTVKRKRRNNTSAKGFFEF